MLTYEKYELNEKMVKASKNGNLDEVKICINLGADKNYSKNSDVINWLTDNNYVSIDDYVMFNVCDICTFEKDEMTSDAFLIACEHGHINIVKYFIEELGQNIHVRHDLCLRKACEHGHYDIVVYFLSIYKMNVDEYVFNDACSGRDRYTYKIAKYIIDTTNYVPTKDNLYMLKNCSADKNVCNDFIKYIKNKKCMMKI